MRSHHQAPLPKEGWEMEELRADEAEPSQHGDSLETGNCSTMFVLHECHPDELDLESVSSICSSSTSSTFSEDLGLSPGKIVIDTGTRSCRGGFSGHPSPTAEISSLVGRRTAQSPLLEEARCGVFVGEEALLYPDTEITDVMQNGLIANWEVAENLWHHLLEHELHVSPRDHALLLTEPPFSPASSQEKMAEVAFEALQTPGLFMASQPVLAAYAHGRTSALVLDMGHVATRAVPVLEGSTIAHGSKQTDVAGRCLTWYLLTLLENAGHTLNEGMTQVVEDIKRTCCYVTIDFQREHLLPPCAYSMDFPLPDGKTLTLGKEQFQCPELLFNPPPCWGESYVAIHELVQRSLTQLSEEIRPMMCSNILLCGGSSMFRGLARRLCNELLGRLPCSASMHVVNSPLRQHASWTGGSILASLRNFQSCWIHRHEYYENGPRIVYQKCF